MFQSQGCGFTTLTASMAGENYFLLSAKIAPISSSAALNS
jgi:hypothetical protein